MIDLKNFCTYSLFSSGRKKSFLFCVFFLIFLTSFLYGADSSGTENSVIKIEHAQKTEYKKNDSTNEDMIILSGEVKLTVTKGSTSTIINAETVNFNRKTNILYAEGDVKLEQVCAGEGKEKISATSLLFNTLTFEGVFDDGRAIQTSSDTLNLPSGSTLIVSSDVFGKDSKGTVAFKGGNLTFCDDENPHWQIRASRIWLLPGGEFAFLNALLYVGRVPLLWLPAFYYPKDELIFNPVFGYRNREGYYINTTTYLYGRKPAGAKSNADIRSATTNSDTGSSEEKTNFISLMNTNRLKKQELEGLILHNLDEDFTGDTSHYAKVMVDYYANLGVMVGFDANLSPFSFLPSLKTNFEFAFSNTIFKNPRNNAYVGMNIDGERVSDSSSFMGTKVPFRYQANIGMTFSKPFTINVSLPLYSDPYYGYDFNTRAETMDWIDYAMNGAASNNDDSNVTTTSSFTWDVTASHSFPIPEAIDGYVTTLDVQNLNSNIVFSSKANTKLTERDEYEKDPSWATYTPERNFFYPSQITPVDVSLRVGGNIVKYPKTKKTSKNSPAVSLSAPDEMISEEDLLKKKEEEEKNSESEKESEGDDEKSEKETEKITFSENALPSLTGVSSKVRTINPITYSLDYSIVPAFTSQVSYNSTNIDLPDDFDWSDMQSTYIQTGATTSVTSALAIKDGLITLNNTLDFAPFYQVHPYLKEADLDFNNKKNDVSNGGYSEDSIKSIRNADNNAMKLDLIESNALVIKPLYFMDYFSESSISWNTSVKLLRSEYISTDPDNAEWDYFGMDLSDHESFTVHNLNFLLAAKEGAYFQKLLLSTTLPPQPDRYAGELSFGYDPYWTFSTGTGVKRRSSEDDEWVNEDFLQNFSMKLFNSKINFTQAFRYNVEENYADSLKFSLSGYGAQLSYIASYVSGYEFVPKSGWMTKTSDKRKFQPYSLSISYSSPSKAFRYLNDKISFAPTLSTSFVYDYLKPTGSYFSFTPAFTFKVNKLLDVTFSTESRNSSIFRYFCSKDDYEYYYQEKGERNLMADLFGSFSFADESKRRASAFKLKTFKITAVHDLDDWDLNFEFSITPRYISATSSENKNGGRAYYDFEPYMKLSVSWRPLSSMKTQIVDKYGTWKLNHE